MGDLARRRPVWRFEAGVYVNPVAHDIEFRIQSAELAALAAAFPQFRFTRLQVSGLNDVQVRHDSYVELARCSLSLSGEFDDLIAAGFAHQSWLDLPPCGARRYATMGFGSCQEVRRLKRGVDRRQLSHLSLDRGMAILAPILLPLHWRRPDAEVPRG